MQDQPIQRNVAAEFDRTEREVLDLLLDPDAPGPWSVHEVGVALRSRVRAEHALSALHRAGLVHRCEEFVFASRPAMRCMQLADTK
jgi:predicted transcriptional regulator